MQAFTAGVVRERILGGDEISMIRCMHASISPQVSNHSRLTTALWFGLVWFGELFF